MSNLPDPDLWQPPKPGLGTCFHQALNRWALLRESRSPEGHGWRVAIGVVRGGIEGTDNVHAWLERGPQVISAATGAPYTRARFYQVCGIDPATVRLINPKNLLRRHKQIDRYVVHELLETWGGRYRVTEHGGVVAE